MGSTQLKAPFPYFGGKSVVALDVWERFGDVPNYVEPFFGSGAVLLARPHSPRTETINDADGYVANFWRAVQADPEAVARHADWPVSECDLHARHLWLVNTGRERVARLQVDPEYFDAQVAGWWVWGLCQWIGSGWCSGKGPHRLPKDAGVGVEHKRPHLMTDGKGIHRVGVKRQTPHLGNSGRGLNSQGVSRQMPSVNLSEVCGHGGAQTCAERREGLVAVMQTLADRLRRVRVCCGDWSRVCTPSVTEKHGITAVFLDPPYAHSERHDEVYTTETDCAAQVREWALAHGDNPLYRIALCGYDSEHQDAMPDTWECFRWKARGGYGSQGEGRGRENAGRECIWFSPHCLKPHVKPVQSSLFGGWDDPEPAPTLDPQPGRSFRFHEGGDEVRGTVKERQGDTLLLTVTRVNGRAVQPFDEHCAAGEWPAGLEVTDGS